jgi:hypothetical protein
MRLSLTTNGDSRTGSQKAPGQHLLGREQKALKIKGLDQMAQGSLLQRRLDLQPWVLCSAPKHLFYPFTHAWTWVLYTLRLLKIILL